MDIMEKINELVEKITDNEKLMKQFKEDPIDTVKKILGNIDLDDEIMDKLVKGVQGKISLDKAGDLLDGLKKLF